MPLVGAVRRRRCPDSTPAAHRATRAFAIPPIRPQSRRSLRSCAPLATAYTAGAFAASSSYSGALVSASAKRCRSPSRISTTAAARYWSDAARAADAEKSAWTNGRGSSWALAQCAARSSGRSAVLHRQRPDPRTALVERGGPRRAAPSRRGRWRATTLCSAPAPPRARRRDGPRRRPADRHSAPARPQQPWDHLDLAPRHRQCRDHRYRPRPPRTDDPRQHVATASDP
jgi:hypothetical protein